MKKSMAPCLQAILMVCLLSSSTAFAEPESGFFSETDCGIYSVLGEFELSADAASATGNSGYSKNSKMVELSQATRKIPLDKGVVFGCRVKIETTLPRGKEIVVRYKHPPITNEVGKTFTEYTMKVDDESLGIFSNGGLFYKLSNDYELVGGNWVFSILIDGITQFERTFQVE